MSKKVCKKCKIFVEKNECPICKGSNFSDNWKGRVYIVDADKSEIGKNMEIKVKGEYAIKVR
jgi:RNA polymerase subunit RPABC4/transcription elongation factor Spt4